MPHNMSSNFRKLLQKIPYCLIVTVVFFTTSIPASALTDEIWDFFDLSSIFYYDPEEITCVDSPAITSDNLLYNGNQILSASALANISANRSFYESAAAKYNIPWQILATIHYREAGAIRYNPDNGQGAYQLYSYTAGGTNSNRFTPGSISDAEFQSQTDLVAKLINDNYGAGLDLSTDTGAKTLFFRYNGAASSYISQARTLGYTAEEAARGEGSPYVMNLADSQRDSSVNPSWRQILRDGGTMQSANSVPGAFLIYASLDGSTGVSYCFSSSNGSGNGDINATALNLAWNSSGHRLSASPAYLEALQSTGLSGYSADSYAAMGASCDAFVATVMRASGADPGFVCCGVSNGGATYNYVRNSGKYIEVPNDPAYLKPGDIRMSDSHIELYVEVNGVGKIASASYGERTGEISNFYDNSSTFKAYRLVKASDV